MSFINIFFLIKNRLSSKSIIEKLLDHVDLNLTLTFEHILKQLFSESTSETANEFYFIDALLDYYLDLTIHSMKKHSNDEFLKQILPRQSSFLQLISFVIPYDKKHRLSSHFYSIIQHLVRKIDAESLDNIRYQLEIISNLLKAKSSHHIPQEFYDSIIKKLLNYPITIDQNSWINCMKQLITIIFLKEPMQISANDLIMKFLQSLADQINWPLDNLDHQSRLNDISWRTILIRLLALINSLLSHRVQTTEYINSSPVKKTQKHDDAVINNDDENDINNENSFASSPSSLSSSRQTHNDDDDDNIDNQEDLTLIHQQHSDLSQLESELLQSNSFFYSIEKWIESVRIFLF